MYRLFIDSVKLFYVNAFLGVLLIEMYAFISFTVERFSNELPLFELFFSGTASIAIIPIWMVVANDWYGKGMKQHELLVRSLLSETPFLLYVLMAVLQGGRSSLMSGFLSVVVWFVILFPLVIYLAKPHSKGVPVSAHAGR